MFRRLQWLPQAQALVVQQTFRSGSCRAMTRVSPVIASASIIITSYNYGRFIGDTIRSALSQTFPNVEVIVVDDGSTDNSLAVIRSFGDRITLIAQKNKGAAAAEYAGIVRSTGDLVIIVDSDDFIFPTAIEEAAALFTRDTTKVQFYLKAVDVSGSPLGFTLPPIMPREDEIEDLLFRFGSYPLPPTTGNAYSREFLLQVLPCLQPGIGASTDLYLSSLAPLYGKVRISNEILGGYRVHRHNMTGQLAKPSLSTMRPGLIAIEATQRALEVHCNKLNRFIQPDLYWRQPYYCKQRLISLRADPDTHPFPKDGPFKLAWYGLKATLQCPTSVLLCTGTPSLIDRWILIPLFIILAFFPSRFIREYVFILDGGRTRLMKLLRGILNFGKLHVSKGNG